jgi:hypothetical protein
MKTQVLTCLAMATLAVLKIPLSPAGEEQSATQHHHYRLIAIGTFGGPQVYFNGDEFLVPCNGLAQNVHDSETLIGWADTSAPDPYSPNCFNVDCYGDVPTASAEGTL